ncbi:Midasin [Aphelenchoides fujianensis]|nr:Midasin [Aphelenchoides fujianensis]
MATRKRKSTATADGNPPASKQTRVSEDLGRFPSRDECHQDPVKVASALMLIKHNTFVKISGPNGSGRTRMAMIAAEAVSPQRTPIVIYVNDQWDSKSLFGSYACSGIPGDFTWEESTFAKASSIVTANSMVILKGFESATPDLVAAVLQLGESGFHPLPGGRCIRIEPTVRIVAIVTEGGDLPIPRLLSDYPIALQLQQYTTAQVVKLVHRSLQMDAQRIEIFYACFTTICEHIAKFSSSERRLGIRDFLVGCRRVCKQDDEPAIVFSNLFEAWILHLSKAEYREQTAAVLLNCLSLDVQTFQFQQNVRFVEIAAQEGHVKIGRATLEVQTSKPPSENISAFALTRDYRNLLERIGVCVANGEPVLLNGETGIGKTRVIQQLADYANVELSVVNLSLDSDASDLIGGFKPTSLRKVVRNFMGGFFALLGDAPNHSLLRTRLLDAYASNDFSTLLNSILDVSLRAIEDETRADVRDRWGENYAQGRRILDFLENTAAATPFAFESGVIARAIKNGEWLLIDEINMATVECLNSIASLLNECEQQQNSSFRLFACMNPATDSGKRRLPAFIRSKFTEFFVEETRDKKQLNEIIKHYMPQLLSTDSLTTFYMEMTQKLPKKFSLRNLCRSLLMTRDDVFRDKAFSLYTALELGFAAGGDLAIAKEIQEIMWKHNGKKPPLKVRPLAANVENELIEGVRFARGPLLPAEDDGFVYTNSVRTNLQRNCVRDGQGPLPRETSAGKTSILTHLARRTGHLLHRINNHEHTDVQEYLGSYVVDERNQLVFREGVLLQAMRNGDWVILDELNLAPTEVLESLNRLLDDNREMHVAETDSMVKAHPRFRIFATQNPVGAYSGRKRLSRAFMNRFVILNVQQPPNNELAEIVCARCHIHQTAAEMMIQVMTELKSLRSTANLFSATDSFMTLRDLFRWANRFANFPDHSDWRQVAADQGYLLLAGRCRKATDILKIQEVISHVTKRAIDVDTLFSLQSPHFPPSIRELFTSETQNDVTRDMILTTSLRKMIVHCAQAFAVKEPVLLVGETGCGKTSVVYMLAEEGLKFINLHERTDTSDLLGRIRPSHSGMFQWEDGVVVRAMRDGHFLLLDEISLAQDSVLERLNPLLEPERTLLLTDCGAHAEMVVAAPGFQCVATMNPGGDHGKKELSKALRNRFTEIWCSFDFDEEDVAAIICRRIQTTVEEVVVVEEVESVARFFAQFFGFFQQKFGHLFKTTFSVRDSIVVAEMFCTFLLTSQLSIFAALYNTISSVILDSLPVLPTRGVKVDFELITAECQKHFLSSFQRLLPELPVGSFETATAIRWTSEQLFIGDFHIPNGPFEKKWPTGFYFDAPSSLSNAMRVARGLASEKPIMLEGSPGAGKSSLVKALATLSGYELIRVNLSEETEVSDLFGTDVPITLPDGQVSFEWQDGPVLKAIKEGAWLLLDEMNLASQSILESLNSCFDFRNTLYIAELGRTFEISRDANRRCRFFACQNPDKEGGGRKSLPKSFLNRFTKIYVRPMTDEDMRVIVGHQVEGEEAALFIGLHNLSNRLIASRGGNQFAGAPREFNLRDLLRFIDASKEFSKDVAFDLVYISRLHKDEDRSALFAIACSRRALNRPCSLPAVMIRTDDEKTVEFGGEVRLQRSTDFHLSELNHHERLFFAKDCQLFASQTGCNFLALLVAPANSGKRSTVELLARLANMPLRVLRMTSETDAQDLLGSYEQVYFEQRVQESAQKLEALLRPYAHEIDSQTLNSKLDIFVRMRNANDIRTIAYSLLSHIKSEEVYVAAQTLVREIAAETLHFEWMDSDLVRAYTNGEWLLIEDVNMCSAAVLDRLNCCLEQDGELVITEKADGEFKAVTRHPNFRIFFTMNAEAGQPVAGDAQPSGRNPTDGRRAVRVVVRTYGRNARLKLLGVFDLVDELRRKFEPNLMQRIESSELPPVGGPISLFLRSFYMDGWFFFLKANDPAVVFLYSRIASGADVFGAMSDCGNMSKEVFLACREVCKLEIFADWTILGIEANKPAISDEERAALNTNISAHLWVWLQWILERVDAPAGSALNTSLQALCESKAPDPTVEAISKALAKAEVHSHAFSNHSADRFLRLLFECAIFDALLRQPWNAAIGDVALVEVGRQLEDFGLRDLLSTDYVRNTSKKMLEFGQNEHCDSNWRRLCPLPLSAVVLFGSQREWKAAEARLKQVERVQMAEWTRPADGRDFVVDVSNQFLLIASLVNLLSAASVDRGRK